MAAVPTISILIGPIGAGGRAWRRWATATKHNVIVANTNHFPVAEWICSLAERIDIRSAAVRCLGERAGRNPDEFLASWNSKTSADRERFGSTLTCGTDEDQLLTLANLSVTQDSRQTVAMALSEMGERIMLTIARLTPIDIWAAVLFVAGTTPVFSSVGQAAATWAARIPALPLAVLVPVGVWREYLDTERESRVKSLLREGEVVVPIIDAAIVGQMLRDAGALGSDLVALAPDGADAAYVESAVNLVQATAAPPITEVEADRARSAAERFLFEFLESMTETAGRFELNAQLDFRLGPRLAEVDLLCRSPRIALEIDGYYHFRDPAAYRRDRTKDWELQRRGYLVLRFLADDVIRQLESIRDRILDAIAPIPPED
jgi:very-short-patch-repair endonuclease